MTLRLVGKTIDWRPLGDPPGSWVFADGDEILAELTWSRPERLVRIETAAGVWNIDFQGMLVLRGSLMRSTVEVPELLYAGGLHRGRARAREGRDFVLFSQWDRSLGSWTGFDDADGTGIVRVRGRVGRGEIWSEVTVTPDPFYGSFAPPLVLLWGGLRILQLRHPWLGILSAGASARFAQKEIERLQPAAG